MSDLFSDEDSDSDDRSLDELDAESLVRRALDEVLSAKSMPLSSSVLVARDQLADLLHRALDALPDELRQARWTLRERDELLAVAGREIERLKETVREEAERRVSQTEIVRQATQVAQKILDHANEDARRMRHEAEDYCDKRLASMEIVLERVTRTVKAGREKLQATPPAADPHAGAPVSDETRAAEDGFFDQDLA